jgi:hypothetical protein
LSLVAVAAACGGGRHPGEHARALCEDVYDRTDFCLADIGCEGAVDPGVYVDQCLTEQLSDDDRNAFLATSCDDINAGACLADASFYRANCDCAGYSQCSGGTVCTSNHGDAVCLDHGAVPEGAPACDSGNLCPAGWVCALPDSQSASGHCVQFCVP